MTCNSERDAAPDVPRSSSYWRNRARRVHELPVASFSDVARTLEQALNNEGPDVPDVEMNARDLIALVRKYITNEAVS
jgi:hypothetical protein